MSRGPAGKRSFFAGTLLVFTLLLPGVCFAETRYALLVGVNKYRNLPERDALLGPANDVALILGYLTGTKELGFRRENIIVLANGPVAADGEPDHDAIVAAMASMAGRVAPGDFVYLHFSGHGSRQKARNPATEPDGQDEVFLPADTGKMENGIFPAALVDDDLGAAIDGIRASGAFVFAVFDSCNSSSATRAAGQPSPDIAERWLPDATYAGEEQRPVGTEELRVQPVAASEFKVGAGNGGLVTFFAAQTIEPTPEMPLPQGAEGAKRHGLFTYTLFDVLARKPGLTYRQLAQGVMHSYAAGNFSRPTPLFEGELDRVVFGHDERPPLLQWPVDVSGGVARLAAGALHGLARDAILAVLPDPLAESEQAIGYLRLTSVGTMSATAVPVEHAGIAAPRLSDLPAAIYARPIDIPLAFELTVELPSPQSARFSDATELARRAVSDIAADRSLPMNLKLVEPGGNADLRLVVGSDEELFPGTGADAAPRLWFLPPDGRFSADRRMKPHSIGLAGGFSDEQLKQTKENLAAVFRATSLSRLSALSTLDSKQVDVRLSILRRGSDTKEPIDPARSPVVSPGDEIHISIDNRSTLAVDVDVLLIGPSYSIQHMMGERFQVGGHLETPIVGIGPSGFGLRRLLLIMREAPRNSDHADLGFLQQVGLQTRGPSVPGTRDFDQLLYDIGNAPATRGSMPYKSKSALKGLIEIFAVESIPR